MTNTPQQEAKEIVAKFHDPKEYSTSKAKRWALIFIKDKYDFAKERLTFLKATGAIISQKTYLFRLNELTQEEKEIKQEIEKL